MKCLHCQQEILIPYKGQSRDLVFCCMGCETVYHALKSSNLLDYYRYKEKSSEARPVRNSFNYLDHKEYQDEFFEKVGDDFRLKFYVEGIHCNACIWLFQKLPEIFPEIKESKLDFNSCLLILRIDQGANISKLISDLQSYGYPLHPVENRELDRFKKIEKRKNLNKLAIAFFATGNIMLLSVSLYAGASGFFKDYFNLLTFLLSLPVILYSGSSFFINAYYGVRKKVFNIDIALGLAIAVGFVMSVIGLFINDRFIYFDTLSMLILLLLSARYLLSEIKDQAQKGLDKINFYSNIITKRETISGVYEEVHSRFIKQNDILLLEQNDTLGVDAKVLQGETYIDKSIINGENKLERVKLGDTLNAGIINKSKSIKVKALSDFNNSFLGKLVTRLQEERGQENSYTDLSQRVAKYFMYFSWSIAFLCFYFFPLEVAIERALAIIIITCPCALGLVVPLTMLLGLKKLSLKGVYVKDEKSITKITNIKNAFLDKTGTLTHSNIKFSCTFFIDETDDNKEVLNQILNIQKQASHPIAKSFFESHINDLNEQLQIENLEEFNEGLTCQIATDHFKIIKNSQKKNSSFDCFKNEKLILSVDYETRLKEEAYSLIRFFKNLNINVQLISGDKKDSVLKVARELDISKYYFELDPIDKAKTISAYSNTLMLGDGVNDSLSFKKADVSIAVANSVDFALKCSDVYLAQNNLNLVATFYHISQLIIKTLKRNICLSLILNLSYITLALMGHITPLSAAIIMPLTSLILLSHTIFSLNDRKKTFYDNYHVLNLRKGLN